MNNVELAEKVKGYLKGSASKAAKFEDLVAVTFSLISENTEDMYVTVREGKILVDPYHYDDNNCAIEASAETIDKLFGGALAFDKALADGEVKVKSGDVAKFKALEVLVPTKKATAKKPVAKTEPKGAAKAVSMTETKPIVKDEAPKTESKPAVKGDAVKTENKPAAKPANKKGKKK